MENANRGVMRGVLEELAVQAASPADTTVRVQTGAAFVQGIWYLNNADLTVNIASNASGSTRIDIVVLEADYTAQTVRIDVVQGTPAAGLPSLTQSAGSVWQIPLAYLTLASGFTTIPSTVITDLRHYANIPSALGIDVTNSSGSTLEQGSVVIWLAAGGQAINTTTSEGSANIAGIIETRVLNGATGRIITHGIVSVLCDESVAVDDYLTTSTTAGQAQKATANSSFVFARVLTANSGAGTRCLAFVTINSSRAALATGTYTGNGAATQAVTGLAFKPRMIIIWNQVDAVNQPYGKTDQDGLNAMNFGNGNYKTDHIISFDDSGFTVGDGTGDANRLNVNLRVYTFMAWR